MLDVLSFLKEQLAAEEAKAAAAATAVEDLKIAIGALVAKHAGPPVTEHERPVRLKRGELMRAILDAVRDGKGERDEIGQAVSEAGIDASSNSISNAIHRLKKHIIWDSEGKRYVLREEDPNRAALISALKASVEMVEGSKVVALKPSVWGGPVLRRCVYWTVPRPTSPGC
jgi:hypothetical protein